MIYICQISRAKKINMKETLLYMSVILVAIIRGLHIIKNYSDPRQQRLFYMDR